jgi:ribA/ribD-fused uncharacterized protein
MSVIFFYGSKDKKYGYLSQFYKCIFKYRGVTYICAEQWMMAWKAKLFNDKRALSLIMHETNPARIKMLGRTVRNFDQKKWEKYRYCIVRRGNLLKFQQNPDLARLLLSTRRTVLAEAAPRDRIWGIGCGVAAAPRLPRSEWGKNLLGRVLMDVRGELAGAA